MKHRFSPSALILLAAASVLAPSCTAPAPEPDVSVARAEKAARVTHTIVVDNRTDAIARAKADDKLLLYSFTGFNSANCRAMEGTVFLDPAVAETMKEHFVEARLHTDTQNTLTDAQFADNRKAQAELAGTPANPYFVVVDAKTGKKIAEHALSGGPSAWTPGWIEFLKESLEKASL